MKMFLLMQFFHPTTYLPELHGNIKALQQISRTTNVDGDLFEKT